MKANEQRERLNHKLRVLNHAKDSGSVTKTYRYFGIPRESFYKWKRAYERALNSLNKEKSYKRSIKGKTLKAGRNHEYLLKVLSI